MRMVHRSASGIRCGIAVFVVTGAVGTGARAGVLWDQIGATGSDLPATGPEGFYRYGSQVFSGQPQYDVIALDDFTLAGESRIERLEAVIQGYGNWSGTGNIQGFVARVFASPQAAAGGFGNAVATLQLSSPTSYSAFGTGLLCGFDVDFSLGAGQWWIGLQAIMPGSAGQVGVVISNIGGAPQAVQANPGGGFNVPGNLIARPVNLAYRVSGTAVPGPGAWVLTLGATAMRRRRR
jgi:hypothetical protein